MTEELKSKIEASIALIRKGEKLALLMHPQYGYQMWLVGLACNGWYPYNPISRKPYDTPPPMPKRQEAETTARKFAQDYGKQLTLSFT